MTTLAEVLVLPPADVLTLEGEELCRTVNTCRGFKVVTKHNGECSYFELQLNRERYCDSPQSTSFDYDRAWAHSPDPVTDDADWAALLREGKERFRHCHLWWEDTWLSTFISSPMSDGRSHGHGSDIGTAVSRAFILATIVRSEGKQ